MTQKFLMVLRLLYSGVGDFFSGSMLIVETLGDLC